MQGRFHHRGKSLSAEIRGDIIDSVLEAGGDSTNGYFPLKHGRSNCQTYGCCGSARLKISVLKEVLLYNFIRY